MKLFFLLFCVFLQNIISRLEQSPALSFSGRLLLVLSIIQHADIRPPSHESSTLPYLNDSLSAYKRGMTHLLDQVIKLVAICTFCVVVLCPYHALPPYFATPSCAAILRRHLAPPACIAIFSPLFYAVILFHHIVSVDKHSSVEILTQNVLFRIYSPSDLISRTDNL